MFPTTESVAGRGLRLASQTERKERGEPKEDFGNVRLTVFQWGSGMADFLEYQRSRLRVARSTVINAAMAGVFGTAAAWGKSYCPWIALGAAAVCWLAWRAFVAIDRSYNKRLRQAYELVKHKAPAENAS